MKKALLFAAFAAAVSLVGCDKETPTVRFDWYLEVKNETGKEIVIENWAMGLYGAETATIAPGQSGTVGGQLYQGKASNTPLQDNLEAGDILPFGTATLQLLPDGGYWLDMTVGGEAVSGEIWTRKYWSFSSDNTSRTYSLTITDELLAKLSPAAQQ